MHKCSEALNISNGLVTKDEKDATEEGDDGLKRLTLLDAQQCMQLWSNVHDDLVQLFTCETTVAAALKFKDYVFGVMQAGFHEKSDNLRIVIADQLRTCLDSSDPTAHCWQSSHSEELLRLSTAEVFTATDAASMKRLAEASDNFIKLAGSGLVYLAGKDGMKLSSKPSPECKAILARLRDIKACIGYINKVGVDEFIVILMTAGLEDERGAMLRSAALSVLNMYDGWAPSLQSVAVFNHRHDSM